MTSKSRFSLPSKLAAILLAGAALSGCISPVALPDGRYTRPIGGAPVVANPTPYSAALVCMSNYARTKGVVAPRIAVGRIVDYTGKVDVQGGRQVTQGASLMAISAFAKAGARLVERFDTSVSELELKYANNRLISDEGDDGFRKIVAGQLPGSDYYVVGGITELNFNIRSTGLEAFGGDDDPENVKLTGGLRLFVINVGLDLRLVDTQSLEVVDVISYQKQILGREISTGAFSFFGGDNVIDVGAGERALEPIQLAIRSVVERATLEMVANLYGAPGPEICADALGPKGDPLSPQSAGRTGDFDANQQNIATNNGTTRANPDRWNRDRDARVEKAIKQGKKAKKNQ